MKLEFFSRPSKNIQISNFTKVRAVTAEVFHTEGQRDGQTDRQTYRQTDMTKLTVAFRNFANAPDSESERHDSVLLSQEKTYVGHLESKERLRIQPAQLFNFS